RAPQALALEAPLRRRSIGYRPHRRPRRDAAPRGGRPARGIRRALLGRGLGTDAGGLRCAPPRRSGIDRARVGGAPQARRPAWRRGCGAEEARPAAVGGVPADPAGVVVWGRAAAATAARGPGRPGRAIVAGARGCRRVPPAHLLRE